MNAPACQTCGQLLRWIPESNGWGCDRCRQFHPVNAPAPPPPAYPPPAHPPHPPRAGGKSKAPLVIAIVAVLAAGGGVAAFLLLRGGDDPGAGSADGLIKSALAAVAKGDVDGIVKLADPKGAIARGIECKGEEAKREMDPEKQERKIRREYGDAIENAKGMKIELVSSKERKSDDDDDVMKKGKEVEDGCIAKMDLRVVTYDLELELEDADGNKGEQQTEIRLLDIGGRYFLIAPPEIKIGPNYKAVIGELEGFRDKMCACKDTTCADAVEKDFMSWGERMSREHKDDKPDEKMTDAMMPVLDAYSKCAQNVMTAAADVRPPPPPPPPDPSITPPSPSVATTLVEAPADMPAACVELRTLIGKLANCADYYGKDGVYQTWAAMVETWNTLPKDSRTGMGQACSGASDVLKQGAPAGCI